MENSANEYNIGIDLGMKNCSVSVFVNNRIQTIPIDNGNKILSSALYLGNGYSVAGRNAKLKQVEEPSRVIYGMKRMLGQLYDDPSFQEDIENFTFPIKRTENGGVAVVDESTGKLYTPVELTAMLIRHAIDYVAEYLNGTINEAVISVPAYFNNVQRNDVISAGTIAGIKTVHLISEPTASAIAYGLMNPTSRECVLVFDFGGGSLDVSIVQIEGKVYNVLSCSGNAHLGGEDITNNLMKKLVLDFNSTFGLNMQTNSPEYLLLKEQVEEAKINLSSVDSYDIDIENLMGVAYHRTITRDFLILENEELFKRCIEKIDEALQSGCQSAEDIDHVLLLGGASATPYLRDHIINTFGKQKVWSSLPSEAVSQGAAIVAGTARDVTEKTYDFHVAMYTTTLNLGNNKSDKMIINELTPMNLGIHVSNGTMSTIIPAQSSVPCVMRKQYQPHSNNQKRLRFKILQGNDKMADQCKRISEVVVELEKIGSIKECIVEVEFSMDSNSTLYVKATELKTMRQIEEVVDMGTQVLSQQAVEEMRETLNSTMIIGKMMEKKERACCEYIHTVNEMQEAMERENSTENMERMQQSVNNAREWLEKNKDNASYEEIEEQIGIIHASLQDFL